MNDPFTHFIKEVVEPVSLVLVFLPVSSKVGLDIGLVGKGSCQKARDGKEGLDIIGIGSCHNHNFSSNVSILRIGVG